MALGIKAIVFSMGEPTTQLCVESLYRQNIDVEVWADKSSFIDKMKRLCLLDREVLRIDADVIVNDNYPEYVEYAIQHANNILWSKPQGFLWWSQDVVPISAGYMHPEAQRIILNNLHKISPNDPRPERTMWNLPEFRIIGSVAKTTNHMVGIKGYGIQDIDQVKRRKEGRRQVHDWDWIGKLNKR